MKRRCSSSRALSPYDYPSYREKNPLSEGETIGLVALGFGLVAGIGYFIVSKSGPAATNPATAPNPGAGTPFVDSGDSVPFNPSDFVIPTHPLSFMPSNGAGGSTSGTDQNIALMRATGTKLVGMYQYDTPSMGLGVVAFTVETGDGTGAYPEGTTITGVPNQYLGEGGG